MDPVFKELSNPENGDVSSDDIQRRLSPMKNPGIVRIRFRVASLTNSSDRSDPVNTNMEASVVSPVSVGELRQLCDVLYDPSALPAADGIFPRSLIHERQTRCPQLHRSLSDALVEFEAEKSTDCAECGGARRMRVERVEVSGSVAERCARLSLPSGREEVRSDIDYMVELGEAQAIGWPPQNLPDEEADRSFSEHGAVDILDKEVDSLQRVKCHMAKWAESGGISVEQLTLQCGEEAPGGLDGCSGEEQAANTEESYSRRVGDTAYPSPPGDSEPAPTEKHRASHNADPPKKSKSVRRDSPEQLADSRAISVFQAMPSSKHEGYFHVQWVPTTQCCHQAPRPLDARMMRDLMRTLLCWPASSNRLHRAGAPSCVVARGPAVSVRNRPWVSSRLPAQGCTDFVPCLRLRTGPGGTDWLGALRARPRRCGWPSAALLSRLSGHLHLVPVGPSPFNTVLFRLSLSRPEVILAQHQPPRARHCLTLLKALRRTWKHQLVVEDRCGSSRSAGAADGAEPLLSSYMLKTCVLWLSEQRPPADWRDALGSLLAVLQLLEESASRGRLPCYLWPPLNVFRQPTPRRMRALRQEVRHLTRQLPTLLVGMKNPVSRHELDKMNLASSSERESVCTYAKTRANKRFKLNSPIYEEENKISQIRVQSGAVDVDDEDLLHKSVPGQRSQCEVPGCGRWLSWVRDQESHCAGRHLRRCGVCAGELPSLRTPELHPEEGEEGHDSEIQLKPQRQNMYSCSVESRDTLSADADSRLTHCVSQHGYPADISHSPLSPASETTAEDPRPPARIRFCYTVPEIGGGLRTSAVPSFRRGGGEVDDGEIDMASLAAALEEEQI